MCIEVKQTSEGLSVMRFHAINAVLWKYLLVFNTTSSIVRLLVRSLKDVFPAIRFCTTVKAAFKRLDIQERGFYPTILSVSARQRGLGVANEALPCGTYSGASRRLPYAN